MLDPTTFSTRLVYAMHQEPRHTLKEIAQESGISMSTLNRYYRGDCKKPNYYKIRRISLILGINPAYLLRADGSLWPEVTLESTDRDEPTLRSIKEQVSRMTPQQRFDFMRYADLLIKTYNREVDNGCRP